MYNRKTDKIMNIKYNNLIPSYDLKCFKNKKILEKIKNIFNSENISFDENWQITDIPVNIKEYMIVILYNPQINKEVVFTFYSNNTVDICLYDEERCEDVKYDTLKEVLDMQNPVNLTLYSDESIEINEILEDEKQSFLMYWYDIKNNKNNDVINVDIRKLNSYKTVSPTLYELLMQREIIIPKIINMAIENKEILIDKW